jgi:tetratricopeptide (TPR) repeat protein
MPTGPIHVQPQTNVSRLLRLAQRAYDSADYAKAERLYNALLQRHPDSFDALHGLGRLHCRLGRFDTALVLIQTALRGDRGRAEGFASLGLVFHFLRRYKEALISYDEGLALDPGNVDILNRRGVALLELNRPREALDDFQGVLAGDPDHFEALGNCGNALIKLNRPQEAVAVCDRALAKAPENPQLLTNRAVALRRLDRPHEALMSASRALLGNPNFIQARFVESVVRLTLGDFAAGWWGYESRWSVGLLASQRRGFTAPLWLGRQTPELSLAGKTILLHAEQGFGDTIQFIRYAALVAQSGAAKVLVEVQRELAPLLPGVAGVDVVIARGDPLPGFDLHCPLLSLPLAFATQMASIPAEAPYIVAPSEKVALWRERLPPRRPLIGVAWSGDRGHDNDLNRSIALAALRPLFETAGLTFVSLQHDVRETDEAALQNLPSLYSLESKFSDFTDTAAVVSLMDAVIAVDTAVAHLAGAMAKSLFLLLPYAADFRWLRERSDSPWYPTARLYRQPAFGDWQGAIDAVRQDLSRTNFLVSPERLSA